jgi:hypothetical protein
MIKLKEILHRLQQDEDKGKTPLDSWKITDYDFMEDMDFKPDGQTSFSLKKPNIKVYHKQGAGFVIEDYSKTNEPKKQEGSGYDSANVEESSSPVRHVFKSFTEMTDYFTKYNQKWENEPYKS